MKLTSYGKIQTQGQGYFMIKVAIIEDEKNEQEHIKQLLNSNGGGYHYLLSFFDNGNQFFFDFQYGLFDLILMDIDLKDRENGIQISMRLREIDPDVCLVFITNLAQYAIQGYRVNAFDYIVKPINEYDFNQRIASISKMIEERKKEKILISNDGAKVAIAIKDIYYVEVANHSLIYHTSKGDFKTYGSLKEVVKDFKDRNFSLCNSCFLVNLEYVERIQGFSVFVKGHELLISHPKKKSFLESLNIFLGK